MRRHSPSLLLVLVALVALATLLDLGSPASLLAAESRGPKNPGATATPGGTGDAASPAGKPGRPPRYTATPVATSTSTATALPSATPTNTTVPTSTLTSTTVPTSTPTDTATSLPTPTATETATQTPIPPTATHTSTPLPTAVPTYPPFDLEWLYRASMPTNRAYLGVASSGDRIYAVGGMAWDGSIVATVEEYDPTTDSWRARMPMSSPRAGHAVAVSADGKIYAMGGTDGASAEGPVASVERYDPKMDSWTSVASLPEPRSDMSAAVGLNGKIYLFGGTTTDASYSPEAVLEYDPSTDVWTRKADMPAPRLRTAAALASDGRIYVIGGNPPYMPPGYYSSTSVGAYDPEANSWEEMAGLPSGRDSLAAVGAGGKLYAIGGIGGYGQGLVPVYQYEVATNSWWEDTPMGSARAGLGAVLASNGKIYAVGGMGNEVVDLVEEATIHPSGVPWPTATATPVPTPVYTPTPIPSPTPVATAVPGQDRMAVSYQVNPAHTGSMQASAATLPLAKKWSVDFGQAVSYPLIARGKVFVTVRNASAYGTQLYALDAATGTVAWGPIALGGTYFWSAAAYDDGRLFAVNFDGLVRALDAETGQQLWQSQLTGQYSFSSPPTALQGVVYVGGAGSGGTLYALDALTGSLLWSQSVQNGDHSSPALSPDGVFVSYACLRTYKFDRWDGTRLWDFFSGCQGGGGRTAAYHDGRLYVRDAVSYRPDYIFDAQSGVQVGTFQSDPVPAFSGGLGYFVYGGDLTATTLATNATAWSFSADETLTSAPVVMGSVVYVGSSTGNLYGLEATTGQLLWQDRLASGIPAPDEHNVSQPPTGLGAGEGMLVVPAGGLLVAYGN